MNMMERIRHIHASKAHTESKDTYNAGIIGSISCGLPADVEEYVEDDAALSTDRMGSQLPSPYEANPETLYFRKEQLDELYAAIRSLSLRHHAWIICRYGFNDDVYKSLAEMGRIYHLSETRAKRTEDEAIGKLKKEFKRSF